MQGQFQLQVGLCLLVLQGRFQLQVGLCLLVLQARFQFHLINARQSCRADLSFLPVGMCRADLPFVPVGMQAQFQLQVG